MPVTSSDNDEQQQQQQQEEEGEEEVCGDGATRREWVSDRCVLLTYFSGDIESNVEQHFARALSRPTSTTTSSSSGFAPHYHGTTPTPPPPLHSALPPPPPPTHCTPWPLIGNLLC